MAAVAISEQDVEILRIPEDEGLEDEEERRRGHESPETSDVCSVWLSLS